MSKSDREYEVTKSDAKKVSDAMEGLGCAWMLGIIVLLLALASVMNAVGDLIRPDDAAMSECVRACDHDRCVTFEPPNTCRCEACE